NYRYFKLFAETAGNLVYGVFKLANAPTNEESRYETFGVNFAQYVKAELDFRYFQPVSSKVSNAYRIYAGFGIPYGNSEALPSVKKFYAGGSSSMRAWASRTLGPGAYNDTTAQLKYYLGDVKLEANFETRFPLFWVVDGAFFIDAGNIWDWKNNVAMEGSEFLIKRFYKQIAIGTGVGLRLDLSFLLLRFDWGIKVKEAFQIPNTNSTFIWGNRRLTRNDWNLTFAIGYPF
ncbi:MAG: outer membrane protein assembly factor, partial [Bacteroidales bacterium]|nr:outer membrane protein assembly factor [Bacteroidales bacterium]